VSSKVVLKSLVKKIDSADERTPTLHVTIYMKYEKCRGKRKNKHQMELKNKICLFQFAEVI